MSTASPSVPAATTSQYGASSAQHGQPGGNHAGGAQLHGHANANLAGGDSHVTHPSNGGLYGENVGPSPHHVANTFPGAQLSPMATPYGAYGASQHPMYGGTYSSHAYPPYPNYMGHVSHYGHPPHYPGNSNPAYHNPVMNNMVPHGGYAPHGSHMPSHHAQSAMALSMGQQGGAGSPAGHGAAMGSNGVMPATSYNSTPQYSTQLPLAGRHRVTTTLWEDEGTLCFQVDAKGVCVARRHDNNMVNGTKLLNVCGMSRGKRDGILKNEKERIVVKVGAMHLKGVWIAFNRGKQLAEQHGIADALYPLFEPNIQSFLYHPDNYPRTAAVMAAAQERHVQRHYSAPGAGNNGGMKEMGGSADVTGMPLHAGFGGGSAGAHWNNAPQSHEGNGGNADSALHYHYQYHPHYQHHPSAVPPQGHGGGMLPSSAHYGGQGMGQPGRSASGAERRMDSPNDSQTGAHAMAAVGSAPHRRVSGMKRPMDEYEANSNEGHAEGEHGASSNSLQSASDSFQSSGFPPQGFSLDDSVKLNKRSKMPEHDGAAQMPASATAGGHTEPGSRGAVNED